MVCYLWFFGFDSPVCTSANSLTWRVVPSGLCNSLFVHAPSCECCFLLDNCTCPSCESVTGFDSGRVPGVSMVLCVNLSPCGSVQVAGNVSLNSISGIGLGCGFFQLPFCFFLPKASGNARVSLRAPWSTGWGFSGFIAMEGAALRGSRLHEEVSGPASHQLWPSTTSLVHVWVLEPQPQPLERLSVGILGSPKYIIPHLPCCWKFL